MSVIGVVLAGGKSSRMGQDKALLRQPNGKTLLEHSIELLNGLGLDEVVVSRAPDITPSLINIRCIGDEYSELGPLAGIAAVITQYPAASALLVIPTDLPMLSESPLLELCSTGIKDQCSTYFERHYLPCYLQLNSQLKDYIQLQLDNHQAKRSIAGLLANANAIALKLSDQKQLLNANTAADWEKLTSLLSLSN
ncbi:MAG: molybdenum cofactor guanylyltransferase [Thalassolituus sp.]|jgi:molybdopterin-guanine dinucleotide biosynthesis protein A|uniref:molybdenum cofactor guanylyltransferase n=1 Tax=Thalassolituus TaxID=187492 RepID=UPI00042DCB0F|nr:molybdenum cofactor guanylyltransferase [Thalassolituus oleivorans]AHK17912.1 hypothetical protein R615_16460 [Thalassolituus oleivorans R6-15]APR68607.1 molybdenum cofactor guanylyltransferase [Thalassolituus oleivorans]PHQ83849.1 MAG: molybdenum cofactor guanylyltransferase [Thalassobium sp.]PHQ84781.1 MAG: molybdenum cofactor guanylyltransferase [Thalassobium sp.]